MKDVKTNYFIGGKIMKKLFLTAMIIIMTMMSMVPSFAYADSNNTVSNVIIEKYDNGDYAVITITINENDNRGTVSGSKTYTYKNSSNVAVWDYTINGTFTYNGTSSSCTSVSDEYSIHTSHWYNDGHSCWRSGNTAHGNVTMKYILFDVVINTITKNLTLSCSPSGDLS